MRNNRLKIDIKIINSSVKIMKLISFMIHKNKIIMLILILKY